MSEFTVLTTKQIAKIRTALEKADTILVAVHASLGGEAPVKKKRKARTPKDPVADTDAEGSGR